MENTEMNTAVSTPSEEISQEPVQEPLPAPAEEESLPVEKAEEAPVIPSAISAETPAESVESEINIIPEKKNKTKWIILIAAVVLVIAAAVVTVILLLGKSTVDNTYDPYRDGEKINVVTSNYYSGVVEPEETVKVEKDADLKIDKVYVEAGDTVKKGDKLFTYDSAQAKLDLEMAKLEYDGIINEIDDYTNQITELTKQRAEAEEDQKLDYTLQIQQAELNKNRSQMSLKSNKVEIQELEKKADLRRDQKRGGYRLRQRRRRYGSGCRYRQRQRLYHHPDRRQLPR